MIHIKYFATWSYGEDDTHVMTVESNDMSEAVNKVYAVAYESKPDREPDNIEIRRKEQ